MTEREKQLETALHNVLQIASEIVWDSNPSDGWDGWLSEIQEKQIDEAFEITYQPNARTNQTY